MMDRERTTGICDPLYMGSAILRGAGDPHYARHAFR